VRQLARARALSRPPEDEMEVEGCSTRMVEVLEGETAGARGMAGAGRREQDDAVEPARAASCAASRAVARGTYLRWSTGLDVV
jgi:hypothetical protein